MRGSATFEKLDIFLDWFSAINDFGADIFHELWKTHEFSFNLISKLSVMAHDQGWVWLWFFTKALEDGEYKNGGLSHTRYGLAKYINTEDGLWDAFLLHIWRMLKTTFNDGLL